MSKANEFFELLYAYEYAEHELFCGVLRAFDIDPTKPDEWPVSDWWVDPYDGSFELVANTNAWAPTPKQIKAAFQLGFDRFWINYPDSTERYAESGSNKLGPSHVVERPRKGSDRMLELYRMRMRTLHEMHDIISEAKQAVLGAET